MDLDLLWFGFGLDLHWFWIGASLDVNEVIYNMFKGGHLKLSQKK